MMTIKNGIKYFYFLTLGLLVTSCNVNEEGILQAADEKEVEVCLRISMEDDTDTRTTTSTEVGNSTVTTVFADYDAIGVFVYDKTNNKELARNMYFEKSSGHGNIWQSKNGKKIRIKEGTEMIFYAYYPYNETITSLEQITHSIASDQSEATQYAQSDLLYAVTAVQTNNLSPSTMASSDEIAIGKGEKVAVDLAFNHAYSLLKVTIKNLAEGSKVNGVILQNIKPGTILNLKGSEVTKGQTTPTITTDETLETKDLKFNSLIEAENTFIAVLPAQTLNSCTGTQSDNNTMNIYIQDKTDVKRLYKWTPTEDIMLTAGKVRHISISVSEVSSETGKQQLY